MLDYLFDVLFFFSSRRRHTRCALVTGVQTCALPIFVDYGEASEVPAVIWRHDIDYCPALALKIARIEAGRGARCIYHVLVSSPFYNVLDPDTDRKSVV